MFPKSSTISGFWTGFLVHARSMAQVNVSIEVKNGVITGSFDLPNTGGGSQQYGNFTGTVYGHWIDVRVPKTNLHGKMEFHVTLLQRKGPPMMHGVIPMPDGSLATVTLFHSKSPARELSGLWEFLEKSRKKKKKSV
jgi:hypothetical protein